MKKYAVTVILYVEAEDENHADRRVDRFLGTSDYVLGWDVEEISECMPDGNPIV